MAVNEVALKAEDAAEKCACDLILSSMDEIGLHLLANGLKPGTVKIYKRHWNAFAEHLDDKQILEIDELTVSHINGYMDKTSMSQVQRNQAISAIKALLNYFDDADIEISNLAKIDRKIRCAAPKKKVMPILSQREIDRARDFVPVIFPSRHDQFRNGLIFDLLVGTMIRCGELSDIRLCDIDVEGKLLMVRGKGADLNADGIPERTRSVPLTDSLLGQIEEYLRFWRIPNPAPSEKPNLSNLSLFGMEHHLFTSSRGPLMSERNVYRVISNLTKRVKAGNNRGGHLLRRSAATIAHNSRRYTLRQLQVLLGHSDINTTMIYLNVGVDDMI